LLSVSFSDPVSAKAAASTPATTHSATFMNVSRHLTLPSDLLP
jgi:hypothetical protein